MIRMVYMGMRTRDISKALHMVPARIKWVQRQSIWQQAYREFEEKADNRLMDLKVRLVDIAPRAVDKLEGIMDGSKNEGLQRLAANDILDRAGLGRSSQVQTNQSQQQINIMPEQLNVLLAAFRESLDDEEHVQIENGSGGPLGPGTQLGVSTELPTG